MKKVISLLLTAMLLLSMLPATMAEGVEYIPAPLGRGDEPPSSHRTVRTVRYTARPIQAV